MTRLAFQNDAPTGSKARVGDPASAAERGQFVSLERALPAYVLDYKP